MTRTALPIDNSTRPYADFDDVETRIGLAVAFADERTACRSVPAALADDLTWARTVLVDLAGIRDPRARAKAFRAEHGIEVMKVLWFAFADHAALLGLTRAAA